jgi:2-keto-4-pentenoate hydratase/2-oxohepta-3-ene-1,7-dioic acid hydratase in catechol pathway
MKLLRLGEPGQERRCLLQPDGNILDVSRHVRDYTGAFFAKGGMRWLRRLELGWHDLPVVEHGDLRVGPPIAQPSKIICIGMNYADHAAESNSDIPAEPIVFFKAPNTVVGPNDDVLLPIGGEKTDWEIELGVVLGARARYLADLAAAADVIAGYTISNDISERAFQLERGGQWVKGKSCETFNPLGPWLVTPDEIADPQGLGIWLSVNGGRMQDSTTANMIFGVHHLVWYLSQFMVLEPGDLINTGTPAGVGLGMDPPRYLKAGDVMELGIDCLGQQRQPCRQALLDA